jgi:WD40 repeat protein
VLDRNITAPSVWDVGAGKITLLRGHADNVQAVAWSPDGKRIATGSDDLTAKIWDANTAQDLVTLGG